MTKTYNNIETERLLRRIEEECKYINSLDTSTEDAKDEVRRSAEELELNIWEYYSNDVSEWVYDR